MNNNKRNIAIVAGGYSSEVIISLKSAEGIKSFLDEERYHIYTVLITRDKWCVILPGDEEIPVDKNNFGFTRNNITVTFDFAYITIHGTPGENGLLQGYLDMLEIPYSCCGVLAASLTFNKFFCNKFLRSYGVNTGKSVCLRDNNAFDKDKIVAELGLPVFVKPNDGGSSFGTTKVSSADHLQQAVDMAFGEGKEVIVESFIPGTEVTCGCFEVGNKLTILPITEVVSKNEFFDFDAKYNPASVEEITPARISDNLTGQIQSLTGRIYDWIGAKGIIRVDYIISNDGTIYMLEVNTTPGMTATSFIPQQIKAAGMDIKEVMTMIIENEITKIYHDVHK